MRARTTISIIVALLVGAGVGAGATKLLTPAPPVTLSDHAVSVEAYLLPANGHTFTVRFGMGIGDTITLFRIDEQDNEVVVTVRVRPPLGSRVDIGLGYEITAGLHYPVGGRAVIDESTGQPIPQVPN